MRPEQVLRGLNESQVSAVTAAAGPLLICAGAGSGKTLTVTARIAYRVATKEVPPGAIVAVTHSTRAAGNLRDALRGYSVADLDRVATRTIHAAALNQLKFTAEHLGLGTPPRVCTDQFQTVRDIASSLRIPTTPALVRAILGEISWAKSNLLTPEQYPASAAAASRRAAVTADLIAAVFLRFDRALATRGLLDHTDILTQAAAQLLIPEAADQIRRRARFLVVDEYQDTDPAQHALVKAWLGDSDDVTAVGDPRQAIYAFKGADPQILRRFPDEFPRAVTVELTVNYRSTPQILAVANNLARVLPEGADLPSLTPTAAHGPTPSVRAFDTAEAEEQWVAAQIAGAVKAGTQPQHVAVLVRDNRRAGAVSGLLEGRGVPAWVSGGTRFFDAPEIVAVRTMMRGELERGSALPGASLLRDVLADFGFDRNRPPDLGTAAAPVWRARRALLDWVEGMPSAELLAGHHLLAELDRASAGGHQVALDAVFVGTVHAAKGLEFDAVFTLGWDHTWGTRGQDGNLAYVAVTRARKHLTLTWARDSAGGAGAVSPLVELAGFIPVDGQTHLPADPRAVKAAPARRARAAAPKGAGHCRRCKAVLPEGAGELRCCPQHLTGDHARVWAALMSWREDQSVLFGVPVVRILTSAAALVLLAQAPVTLEGLRSVPGIGPVTVARYGQDLLTAVRPLAL